MKWGSLAAIIAAAAVVPAPASADCTADTALVAGAAVTYKGNSWGPIPLYTVDLRPAQNATIDIAANSVDEARANVLAFLEQGDGCNAQPAPPAAPAPAPDPGPPAYIGPAAALAAAADVSYVGNSWGPTPIYRVTLPTLNATVDVAANSADEARSAAISTVAHLLEQAAAVALPPATPAAPEPQQPAAAIAPAAATTDAPAVSPAESVIAAPPLAVLNPLLAAAASQTVGAAVTITRTTKCYLGALPATCSHLYGVMKRTTGARLVVRRRGRLAQRITLAGLSA